MLNIKYISLSLLLGSSLAYSAMAAEPAADNDSQEEACLQQLENAHNAHVKKYEACVKAAIEHNVGDEDELAALDDCDDEYQEAVVSPSEVRHCIAE